MDVEWSQHARDVCEERQIPLAWVRLALDSPDRTWRGNDGNQHYAKAIAERGGNVLHVVVDPDIVPNRLVTVFFDRRLRETT